MRVCCIVFFISFRCALTFLNYGMPSRRASRAIPVLVVVMSDSDELVLIVPTMFGRLNMGFELVKVVAVAGVVTVSLTICVVGLSRNGSMGTKFAAAASCCGSPCSTVETVVLALKSAGDIMNSSSRTNKRSIALPPPLSTAVRFADFDLDPDFLLFDFDPDFLLLDFDMDPPFPLDLSDLLFDLDPDFLLLDFDMDPPLDLSDLLFDLDPDFLLLDSLGNLRRTFVVSSSSSSSRPTNCCTSNNFSEGDATVRRWSRLSWLPLLTSFWMSLLPRSVTANFALTSTTDHNNKKDATSGAKDRKKVEEIFMV